ncbi:hypothetical protein [Pseudomonas sp. TH15]|uniref:hypothetical protein n=1 Tax=Pseudomonas sp. TH15 TaxID=2796381 RepID=UPI001912CCD3|nr:hypothetical protein [Pseudomonas sp. TH15]MBK5511147.1 hypothetical protein [Pseudomonas sp. TH15]
MFIDVGDGQPFAPTPSCFLAGVDIYDREETLGVELEKLDPNDPGDRELIILKYCLPSKRTYRHKFMIFKCLKEALDNVEYDFQVLFEYDPEACSSFPYRWDEMQSARVFFEDVYRLASVEWKDDVEKASLENQLDW